MRVLLKRLCLFIVSLNAAAAELSWRMPALKENAVPALNTGFEFDEETLRKGIHLEPAKPYEWVFAPAEKISFHLFSDAKLRAGDVFLTAWNWNGDAVWQKQLCAPFDEQISFSVEGRGTWLVTLDLFESGEFVSRLAKSFAVLPSNELKRNFWGMDGEFFLGSCLFPCRTGWTNSFGAMTPPGLTDRQTTQRELALDARLGLKIERFDNDALMLDNRSTAGFPADFSRLDSIADMISDAGLDLALQIIPLPWMTRKDYADAGHAFWMSPPEPEAYSQLVQQFLLRYSGRTAFMEIMNEPDNLHFWVGSGQEYVNLFQTALTARKSVRAAPRRLAPLLAGGMTPLKAPDVKSEEDPVKRARMQEIVSGTIDAPYLSFHAHGTLERARKHMEILREMCTVAGKPDMPFVQTEGGICAWSLANEKIQAITALQKVLYAWANNTRGWLFYATRWHGGPRVQIPAKDGGTPAGWGYLDYYFCPRFAYGAIGAFADVYAGAHFERKLAETDSFFVYEFSKGSDRLISFFVLQSDAGPAPEKTISIRTVADRAELIDAMGNIISTPAERTITLTAGVYPQTLRLKNATEAELVP
ncbi:MAG: hypothetical protein WC959_03840 [Kiritimatiellales bacterium]